MKQETNNEMDLLLRKLGRATASVPQTSGNGASGSGDGHLDADELNAYAEHAMPIAARARYTGHLADCSRCRQIVSQLSQAAGLFLEEEPPAPTPGWKAFLLSLFSPVVLRYAVPALGLIIVASLGFLVFRDSRELRFAESRPMTEGASEAPKEPSTDKPFEDGGVQAGKEKSAVAAKTRTESQPEAKEVAKPLAADSRGAEQQQQVTTTDQIAAAPAAAPGANTAAASPSPRLFAEKMGAVAETTRTSSQPGSEPQESVKSNENRPAKTEKDGPVNVSGYGMANSKLDKAKSDAESRRAAPMGAGEGQKRERDRVDKDEAETISAGGRHFRKQGSVWVDVAYSSGQATVDVTRGSEQYRALVADEPGIRTIAEQLRGEVIVVWRGRAYRIR